MLAILWIAAFPGRVEAECGDPAALIGHAEHFAVAGLPQEAAESIQAAKVSFSCSSVVEPELLARMWLAEGALALDRGDRKMASLTFSASCYDSHSHRGTLALHFGYGDHVREAHEEACQSWLSEGQLQFDPLPAGMQGYLDGEEVEMLTDIREGLHLMQIAPPGGSSVFAEILYMAPNETHFILTGLDQEQSTQEAPTAEPAQEQRKSRRSRRRTSK